MKIKRSWILIAVAVIGLSMILYTLARQFLGWNLGEGFESYFFDGVFIAAVGLLLLNRRIAKDEAREKAEITPVPAVASEAEQDKD